jgi:hypothetical protein
MMWVHLILHRARSLVHNVLLTAFLLGGSLAVTGVLVQPDVPGFRHTVPDGQSVDTALGIVRVSHHRWQLFAYSEFAIAIGLLFVGAAVGLAIVVRVLRLAEPLHKVEIWKANAWIAAGWSLGCAGLFVRLVLSLVGFRL